MAITSQLIDLWRNVPSETQRLEFKAAQNQFDRDKLNRYCVALANEGGGFLVLGIADARPRTVVGTQAFPNLIDIAEKLFESIGFRVDVEEVAHPDGRVLVFSVPSYQSRNERLADLMRRMHICEEKSSGIDKVVHAAEVFQLPAPDFRVGHHRTIVTIFGPRPFEDMDREDRVRACYQHCALKWVMREQMTNQTLRERFHVPESKSASISQVISATIEAGLIKLDERVGSSRKLARYLPNWA